MRMWNEKKNYTQLQRQMLMKFTMQATVFIATDINIDPFILNIQ